jgi:hypothetical protein
MAWARGCRGQATVEAVAGFALFLFTGVICFQMLSTGHAASLVDGAAQAAAVAAGGVMRVTVEPPSVIGPIARLLRVSSSVRVHTGRAP